MVSNHDESRDRDDLVRHYGGYYQDPFTFFKDFEMSVVELKNRQHNANDGNDDNLWFPKWIQNYAASVENGHHCMSWNRNKSRAAFDAPYFCDPSFGGRCRHSYGTRVSPSQRRADDNDYLPVMNKPGLAVNSPVDRLQEELEVESQGRSSI